MYSVMIRVKWNLLKCGTLSAPKNGVDYGIMNDHNSTYFPSGGFGRSRCLLFLNQLEIWVRERPVFSASVRFSSGLGYLVGSERYPGYASGWLKLFQQWLTVEIPTCWACSIPWVRGDCAPWSSRRCLRRPRSSSAAGTSVGSCICLRRRVFVRASFPFPCGKHCGYELVFVHVTWTNQQSEHSFDN